MFAKTIAEFVNHATGTSDVVFPEKVGIAMFAPRLAASVWSRLTTEPYKALETLSHWNTATPAEKAQSKMIAKNAGETVATFAAMLAVNQAMVSLMGSDEKVNMTDPSKPDFLKFKTKGGNTIDISGGMIPAVKLIGNILHMANTTKKERHGDSIGDKDQKLIGDYARGKLSPVASTAVEIATKHDYSGNTMPWSDAEPAHKYNHKLTWKEYLWSQAPIPVAEAARDVYRSMEEKGMSEPQINDILTGIFIGAVGGGIGAKVGMPMHEHVEKPTSTKPHRAGHTVK
jgi:hypothetical protein